MTTMESMQFAFIIFLCLTALWTLDWIVDWCRLDVHGVYADGVFIKQERLTCCGEEMTACFCSSDSGSIGWKCKVCGKVVTGDEILKQRHLA